MDFSVVAIGTLILISVINLFGPIPNRIIGAVGIALAIINISL